MAPHTARRRPALATTRATIRHALTCAIRTATTAPRHAAQSATGMGVISSALRTTADTTSRAGLPDISRHPLRAGLRLYLVRRPSTCPAAVSSCTSPSERD